MDRARLVHLPLRWRLPFALLVAIAMLAAPRAGAASTITSSVRIDPVGEFTGDVFGCSVAWIGDVNGDGYDDLLIARANLGECTQVRKMVWLGDQR